MTASMEKIKHVRQWGGPIAVSALDPASQSFSVDGIDGMISYRPSGNYAIVLGDPICHIDEESQLVSAFEKFCQRQNLKEIYIAASHNFVERVGQIIQYTVVQCGENCYLNPKIDPREYSGTHGSLVRRKVRHAKKEGVVIKEYTQDDSATEQAMEAVAQSWLNSRKGFQIYTTHVRLFEDRPGKRWFYAKHEDKIVGIVILNHMECKQGWHISHLIHTPEAPHGTPEALIVQVLNSLSQENCSIVTIGLLVNQSLGQLKDIHPVTQWVIQQAFSLIVKLFRLDGRKKFWEKFHPFCSPGYLLFKGPIIAPKGILAIIKALNAL